MFGGVYGGGGLMVWEFGWVGVVEDIGEYEVGGWWVEGVCWEGEGGCVVFYDEWVCWEDGDGGV